MENHPKVSVIIPMYNCAEYLPDLFNTISNQTFKDFEVLCVIDGATDNTLEIVKEYSEKDDRIRYFAKENGGAGSARNVGLDHASGEYIICIDADDLYSEDILKEMVTAAEEYDTDITMCQYKRRDLRMQKDKEVAGFKMEFFPENTVVNPEEVPNLYAQVTTGPTNKLFRRSIIEENHLRFSTTRVSNDVFFVLANVSLATRMIGVYKNLITVRRYVSDTSITSNRGKHSEDALYVLSDLYTWLKQKGLDERFKDSFCRIVSNSMFYNSEFGENPRFVEKAVKLVNEEEPLGQMSPDEVLEYLYKVFDTVSMDGTIKNLQTAMDAGIVNEDMPNPEEALKRARSRRNNMTMVKAESVVRYGRDFDTGRMMRLTQKLRERNERLKTRVSEQKKRIKKLQRKNRHLLNELTEARNTLGYRLRSAVKKLIKGSES